MVDLGPGKDEAFPYVLVEAEIGLDGVVECEGEDVLAQLSRERFECGHVDVDCCFVNVRDGERGERFLISARL